MTTTKSTRGYLWVPLRLQAMCLATEQSVVRAMADYRRLPFVADGVAHDDNPNLSEPILTPPFAQDLPLPAGIHLHWLLPDALTRGEHDETGTRFPEVPNRWLVLRSGGGKPERQWVVESDYLYPEGYGEDIEREGEAPVNVLLSPDPAPEPGYRYRFLGRALPLDEWRTKRTDPANEHLPALTSVGPETKVAVLDPVRATFASFYPNCRTVFGFHDADFRTRTPPPDLRYDVIGWYADPARDRLAPLLEGVNSPEALKDLLEEQLEWTFEPGDALPQASLYHARLTFTPGARAARDVIAELPKPSLTLAQTETEALAAYLAHVHAPETSDADREKRRLMEDQLEALQLTDRLEGHQLDLDALLMEARHERGFGSLAAGIRWSIQPKTDPSADLFALFRRAPTRAARTPPPAWASLLEALETAEEEHQRAQGELEALRQRMYVRWHALTNAKQVVSNGFFKEYVVPVRQKLSAMGRLLLEQDEATGAFRASLAPVVFKTVSRRYGYYSTYEEVLNAGEPFALEGDNVDSYWTWGVEFLDCRGFPLSSGHTVSVVTRNEAWEVRDTVDGDDVVYPVRATADGITLEIPGSATSIAGRLAAALNALQQAVTAYNATEAGAEAPFAVRALPAAPYWEPADPVLLITGEAAAGAIWQGADDDDLLPCSHVDLALDLATLPAATVTALQAHLAGLGADVGSVWAEPPWNPFMMHWAFDVAPCGRDDNGDYDPDLLLEHYTLGTQGVDQTLKPGEEESFSPTANSYSGISLLSPSASLEVRERVVRYLENEVLPDYYEAQNVPGDAQVDGYLEAHFAAIKAWYLGLTSPPPGIEDPVFTALWSYEELQRTPCLAQSLGNFNQVLLLREPTMQLGILDPIAPSHSQTLFFTDTVRDAMGDSIQQKPLAMDIFNPLRSGAMSITGLWLVDTFGQVKEVVDIQAPDDAKVITTTDLTPPAGRHHALLSPRLAQPARLCFDWLPAEPSGGRRTNDHPETNPVCGFLLVNNLDAALAVYDKEGRALGAVDRNGTWRTAPESGGRVRMSARGLPELPNAHLQRVVEHVLAEGPEFLRSFLSTQRTALETIDPEAYAESPSRALLMARPVAVVRASLRLELQGPPAFDPSAVANDDTTTSRGLEKVPPQ